MIPALKNLPYKDRLKGCNMSTLHYRRVRGDMIETYIRYCLGNTIQMWYQLWKHLASKQPGVMIWEFSKLVLNMTCAVQGLFATCYFRSSERKFPLGTFPPRNENSQELSLLGTNVPGNFRPAER